MIDVLKPLIKQFLPFAQERMGFKDPPRLFLRSDAQNAKNPLGKTAYYDPGAKSVTIYVQNRHPKDIMRSLSHELVHHTQNCNGQFENVGEMGEGYAQNNDHLREMEREAYEMGNLCFRDWEDSIKSTIYFEHLNKGVNNTMSIKDWKNREINTLLTEKWGFKFNLDRLNEDKSEEEDEGFHVGASAPETSEEGSKESIEGEEDPGKRLQKGLQKEEVEELEETGPKRTGASKGDKGKDKDDPSARDYSHGGDRKGDKDAKGEKDYESTKKGDKTKSGAKAYNKYPNKGDKKKGGGKAYSKSLKGLEEGCPPDAEMMVVGDEMPGDEMPGDEMPGDEGPVDTESLMAELLAVVEQLAIAMGVGAVEDDMDDIEEGGLAHRRGGVKDPRNRRPEASSLKEGQIRQMVRRALKKSSLSRRRDT